MSHRALYDDIRLTSPGFDELRDNFDGLVVRIRDETDRGINITFPAVWQYTKADETFGHFFTRSLLASLEPGLMLHWLYEVSESDHFTLFKKNNPHYECIPELKEWLVVLDNEVISVIARREPTISERTDGIRSFAKSLADIGDANSAPDHAT